MFRNSFFHIFASLQNQFMAKKQKYYVVWVGQNTGVFDNWTDCLLQTKGYKGAVYKSFDSLEEARKAYQEGPAEYIVRTGKKNVPKAPSARERFIENALAVDAGCSGNPGRMEYRGVYVANGQQLFHFGPIYGTNNIGEFLAIVHGLGLLKKQGLHDLPIYSDSVNAMNWVKQKKCKTKLVHTVESQKVYELIERAERWLRENTYQNPILKWKTEEWGEIPADFGRK